MVADNTVPLLKNEVPTDWKDGCKEGGSWSDGHLLGWGRVNGSTLIFLDFHVPPGNRMV